ncbi:MAG: peptidoglycan DD-metalloendopeptidase family protein, partial [Thiobacillaceae bacterium]
STLKPAPVVERGDAPVAVSLPRYHVVRAGENLYRIALERGLDYRDLARWNDLKVPDRLPAGTRLRLQPPAPQAAPVPGAAPVRWAWPVQGRVIADFDPARGRKGLHIAASYGSPVRAAADGLVVYTGQALRGYGKLTIVRHSPALLSVYAHQARIDVREGDRVVLGQTIGAVGDNDAEQAMLQFEIREYGRPVNPKNYLPG